MKKLVVNADDFGYTRDVNAGIIRAHTHGILTATTLMANGQAFDDAVALAKQHPSLDVGCHLVLVGGRSLLLGAKDLPNSVSSLLSELAFGRINVYAELRAQIERIRAAGITPTHLDTHKHTHLTFPVLRAVARLSEEFGIRWVRRPFDFPLSGGKPTPWSKKAVSNGLQLLRRYFHAVLSRHGCRTTDHFAGFQLTGYLRSDELVSLLAVLPEGITEFMCHPGYCTDELRAARTRLKESREAELEALTAPVVRECLQRYGIDLTGYRQL